MNDHIVKQHLLLKSTTALVTASCLSSLHPYYGKIKKNGDLNLIISAHIITQTNNSIKNRLYKVILSKVVTLFGEKNLITLYLQITVWI